jgi:hypothetical protein
MSRTLTFSEDYQRTSAEMDRQLFLSVYRSPSMRKAMHCLTAAENVVSRFIQRRLSSPESPSDELLYEPVIFSWYDVFNRLRRNIERTGRARTAK